MEKGKLILFFIPLLLLACNNEPQEAKTDVAPASPEPLVKDAPAPAPLSNDRIAELQASAFDEGDLVGRVQHSIEQIQKQFIISNKLNTPKGQQSITVDEQFNLIVRSEKDGTVQELKVNLKNLDHRNGSMRLIADVKKDDLPGFGVSVLPGKPGVELFTNGKKTGEEKELKIFMADRSLIEQSVPALLQALNVVHGAI